jgi:hypothetical protein
MLFIYFLLVRTVGLGSDNDGLLTPFNGGVGHITPPEP